MSRHHILVIALILGIAAALGAYAATRSAHLGASARTAEQARIAQREQRLKRTERALQVALAQPHPGPHALPRPARAPRVVYVRPAPIVIHKPRAGGERDDGGGND